MAEVPTDRKKLATLVSELTIKQVLEVKILEALNYPFADGEKEKIKKAQQAAYFATAQDADQYQKLSGEVSRVGQEHFREKQAFRTVRDVEIERNIFPVSEVEGVGRTAFVFDQQSREVLWKILKHFGVIPS